MKAGCMFSCLSRSAASRSREVCLFSHLLDTGVAVSGILCLVLGPQVEEWYQQTGRSPSGSPLMLREAEDVIHKGRWRGLGWFSLEKVKRLTAVL